MIQKEYFVIERENNDDYPLFSWDEPSGKFGLGSPVPVSDPIKLRLGDPISPSFEWVDFHKLPDPVVSKKLYDVLEPLDIYGIQVVPAKVRHPNDPFAEVQDYWYVHIWNRISCLDSEKSELRTNRAGTRIFAIDKLVLDEQKLEQIELPKRLIFELDEDTSVKLVHQSVKEKMEATGPKGLRFLSAEVWNSSACFD